MTRNEPTYVAVICSVLSTGEELYSIQKDESIVFQSCYLKRVLAFCDKHGYEIGCDGGPCNVID